MGSDHAEDQKKLVRLLEEWKEIEAKYFQGEEYLRSLSTQALVPNIVQAAHEKMEEVGGAEVWAGLSEEERQKYDNAAMQKVCERFGEEC